MNMNIYIVQYMNKKANMYINKFFNSLNIEREQNAKFAKFVENSWNIFGTSRDNDAGAQLCSMGNHPITLLFCTPRRYATMGSLPTL